MSELKVNNLNGKHVNYSDILQNNDHLQKFFKIIFCLQRFDLYFASAIFKIKIILIFMENVLQFSC